MEIAEIHALLKAGLSSDDSVLESPAWHESALRSTEERWHTGLEESFDWSAAKPELGKHRE